MQMVLGSGPRQRLLRRLQAASIAGVEVPVSVATSADQTAALSSTLSNAVTGGSFAQQLTEQGDPSGRGTG